MNRTAHRFGVLGGLAVAAFGVLVSGSVARAAPSPTPPPFMPRPDDAAVNRALEDEMKRSLRELKLGGEAPPYFVRYSVIDVDRSWTSARLGGVVDDERSPSRSLALQLRVGSPDDDNTNFAGSSPGATTTVTREDDYAMLRRDLWQLTDREYKDALETFARKRASKAIQADNDKDKVADFAKTPPVQSVTNRATPQTDGDRAKLKALALALSSVFREFPKVDNGRASSGADLIRRRLLTSESTWTDERRSHVHVEVQADTVADDGEHINAALQWRANDVAGLPPLEKMQAEARALAKNLTEQRTAPKVDPGVASVVFEGPAAGQLARLLLAAPFSGQPTPRSPGMSRASDGSNSFVDRIGLVVAPHWLSVVDDPTGTGPNKKLLGGGYDTDDEGVAAEKVTLIDKGVAKGLLMSRAPRKDFSKSNGHGRGFGAVHAMASNLFISASPAAALSRAELLAAAKRSAGPKGTVYVVTQLTESSGIGRGQTLQARVATRYKDGKEETVRGLSLEGFAPKKLKKDLVGASKELFVLDEYPQSVVTPALLFEDVDVGRPNDKNKTPPLYPSPLATGGK